MLLFFQTERERMCRAMYVAAGGNGFHWSRQMSYRETVQYWGQPPTTILHRVGGLAKMLVSQGDDDYLTAPRVWISVDDVGAVLWDPEEHRDEEGDCTYLLIVDGQERTVYSKLAAAQFLVNLFDYNNPERNWLEREPSQKCRTDFATHPSWRCEHSLPTTSVRRCAVALVPAHVTTVMSHDDRSEGAFFMRHCEVPLLLTDLHMRVWDTTAWLFDASHRPRPAEPTDQA